MFRKFQVRLRHGEPGFGLGLGFQDLVCFHVVFEGPFWVCKVLGFRF